MAILGIDEVGRGPWAGPLVMGAVILRSPAQLSEDSDFPEWVSALTDSKKLTEKKRTELATQINNLAAATALGWVSASEIDQIGLSQALRLAARRAILKIQRQKVPFSEIIIDGTVNFLSDTPLTHYVTTLKKADALIKEVSAASIIAKVARDDYMHKLFTAYPDYGFERHVGYGTAAHRKALQDFGPIAEHRLSFRPVAQISADFPDHVARISKARSSTTPTSPNSTPSAPIPPHQSPNSITTKAIGTHAEEAVKEYLISRGHQILAHNYRTKFYEIDIISATPEKLYFTEVKYRRSADFGGGNSAVDFAKIKHMRFATEAFCQLLRNAPFFPDFSRQDNPKSPSWSSQTLLSLQPVLAVATVTGEEFLVEDFLELDFRDIG